jgi:hypothetical protein
MKRNSMPIIGDWARIYPPVNENGSWNIYNLIFGGKKNLIKLLIIFGIVALVLIGFYELLSQLESLANNPCVQSCFNQEIFNPLIK